MGYWSFELIEGSSWEGRAYVGGTGAGVVFLSPTGLDMSWGPRAIYIHPPTGYCRHLHLNRYLESLSFSHIRLRGCWSRINSGMFGNVQILPRLMKNCTMHVAKSSWTQVIRWEKRQRTTSWSHEEWCYPEVDKGVNQVLLGILGTVLDRHMIVISRVFHDRIYQQLRIIVMVLMWQRAWRTCNKGRFAFAGYEQQYTSENQCCVGKLW